MWHRSVVAVFTEVPFDEAASLLQRLRAGELDQLRGIAAGSENTNYFADAAGRHWVLTLFERVSPHALPFYLRLMKHLAQRALPVPDPLADDDGALIHLLAGKPAVVVNRLPGAPELHPTLAHTRQVAHALARMHVVGRDFAATQANPRGLAWWEQTAPCLLPLLAPEQRSLLATELAFQQRAARTPDYLALPRGPIHADLFRDNVLFEAGRLSGLLDFYFAGVDHFVFDLAVCLNDWCSDAATGRLDELHARAFVEAYAQERALTAEERCLLPTFLRGAALRFWLSRLHDRHMPRTAALLEARDPEQYERVLRARIAEPWSPGA